MSLSRSTGDAAAAAAAFRGRRQNINKVFSLLNR